MFDAAAYYRSLTPPTFIDPTGKTHVGKIIGADTWFRMQTSIRSPIREDGSVDHVALTKAMKKMVNTFFPPTWRNLWEKTVARWLWEMPSIGRMRAVYDFMQAQASAMGTSMSPLPGTFPISTLPTDESLLAPQTSGA